MGDSQQIVDGVGINVPAPDLNGPQIAGSMSFMDKYNEERDKRIRQDGVRQYIVPAESEKYKHFLDDPWIEPGTPIAHPVPNGGHTKFTIFGAGYGGILFAVNLMKNGFSAEDMVIVDPAGGFGGIWYWNRYPVYMPLLEEMDYMPKRKYASGEELRQFANSIAEKYGLYNRAMFQCSGKTIIWDDSNKQWTIKIKEKPKGGEVTESTITSDFVLLGTGMLNNAKLPDIPGLDTFQGHMFHTARWDYKYTGGTPADPGLTGLMGKKVAFVGTGATAVQSVPEVARWAEHLYVFQRTPSHVFFRGNHDTDPAKWKDEIAHKPGWQRERNENFNMFVSGARPKPSVNMVDDEWSRIDTCYALIGGPQKVTMENVMQYVGDLHAADYPLTESVRKRVEQIVKNAQTAKALQAWYPSWCKRPCFHDEYLPTFNAPNVTLVDTAGKGVDRVTESGIEFGGKAYDVDCIIWSTGFVSPGVGSVPGKAFIQVNGRNGVNLEELNDAGQVGALHGVVAEHFPNLFWPGIYQGAVSPNQIYQGEEYATHIAYIIAEASRKAGGKVVIEPTHEAVEEWLMQLMPRAVHFAGMQGCTPGYFNKEGKNDRIPPEFQMVAARNAPWGDGFLSFLEILEKWRAKGDLDGLKITPVT